MTHTKWLGILAITTTISGMPILAVAQENGQSSMPSQARTVQDITIQGCVESAGSGQSLQGVRVRVPGTNASTRTNAAGCYVLRNVEPGADRVEFSYLGLPPVTQEITPSNNGPVTLNVEMGNASLENIIVRSQRQALNDARNLYRASDSITNFVSGDDIGQFVDQNVAEALQRLPGTSITRDQGEGRFVSVRGIQAGLSTVTINGMRIGTPEDGSRAVPLDVIPSGSIDLLKVTKVPTPDMPGDAIGGTVDVRSASAFDRDRDTTFSYRAEGSWNELSEKVSPKMQANYSDTFGADDAFGISVGFNYLDRKFESDNVETEYDFIDDLGEDQLVPIELQQRKYFVKRKRIGGNVNLEYRPDVNNRFYANVLGSRFNDAEERQRSIFVFEDGDLTSFDGASGRYEDIAEDGFRRRTRFRTKEQDTVAFSVGGEHMVNDWTFDYQVGHSITREKVPDEVEGRFEKGGDPLDAEFTMGNGIPTFRILNGTNPDATHLDNANYALDRVVLEPKFIDDDDTNFTVNSQYDNAFGMNGLALKTGADVRLKRKDVDVNEIELRDVPDVGLDQFTTDARDYGLGDMGQGISADDFIDFFNENRDQFGERPQDADENTILRDAEDFTAKEDVYAGYLMGTFDQGPLRIIAGARVEHTDYTATGNEISIDGDGDLAVGSRDVSSSYTNVLPGVHLRFTPQENLILRAAWSNTIARPSFSDISPRFSINNEDLEIETGNPDLDPYKSTNFDLLMDWYISSSSLMSVGVFYKDIDNYVVDFTTTNDAAFPGYELERPINGTSASIKGLEFNFEHDLGTWGDLMEGFLVGANFTLLDTNLKLDERQGENFQLPETAEKAFNAYVGYEQGRFSGRVSLSHRGKYLNEVGDSEEFDIYVASHTQLDLTAAYRISPAAEVVFEAINLTDAPLKLYQGDPSLNYQFEEYGRTVAVGLRGRF